MNATEAKIRNLLSGKDAITGNEFERKGISFSMLSDFVNNPRLFKELYITKTKHKKQTAAMSFGSKLHTFLLEPHKMIDRYISSDEIKEMVKNVENIRKADYDARVKAEFFAHPFGAAYIEEYAAKKLTKQLKKFKEFCEHQKIPDFEFDSEAVKLELLGKKEAITETEIIALNAIKAEFFYLLEKTFGVGLVTRLKDFQQDQMTGDVMVNPKIEFKTEVKLVWNDKLTGLPCVAKLDLLIIDRETGVHYVIEIKSTNKLSKVSRDGSYRGVHFKFEDLLYYLQAVTNHEGLKYDELYQVPEDKIRFFWVELESNEHFFGHVWTPSETYMDTANTIFNRRMSDLKDCLEQDRWRTKNYSILGGDVLADTIEPSDRMLQMVDYERDVMDYEEESSANIEQ